MAAILINRMQQRFVLETRFFVAHSITKIKAVIIANVIGIKNLIFKAKGESMMEFR